VKKADTDVDVTFDPTNSAAVDNFYNKQPTDPIVTPAPTPGPARDGKEYVQVTELKETLDATFTINYGPLPDSVTPAFEALQQSIADALAASAGVDVDNVQDEDITLEQISRRRLSLLRRRLADGDVKVEGKIIVPDGQASGIASNLDETSKSGALINNIINAAHKRGVVTKMLARNAGGSISVVVAPGKTNQTVWREQNKGPVLGTTALPTKGATAAGTPDAYPPGAIAAVVICSLLFCGSVAYLMVRWYNDNNPKPSLSPPKPYPDGFKPGGSNYGGGEATKLEDVQSTLEAAQLTTYDV
jgi:hypothetical protein